MHVRRSVLAIALTTTMLAPAAAPAQTKTSLSQEGFGKVQKRRIASLASVYRPVGIAGVLRHLDRRLRPDLAIDPCRRGGEKPVSYPLAGVAASSFYRFECTDDRTTEWTPQGLTGADQATIGRARGRPAVQAVSWYRGKSGAETDVRVTIVNRATGRYRHVLLVVPGSRGRFGRVPIHAGGIAWVGKYLYVADTGNGLRVFDTSATMAVPKRKRRLTRGAGYIMPQLGTYAKEPGNDLTYSSASYAAGARPSLGYPLPPRLVVGEYRGAGAGAGRAAAYALDGDLPQGTRPYGSPMEGFPEMQGVLLLGADDALVGSTSDGTRGKGGATLYVRGGNGSVRTYPWGLHPEDLYFQSSTREIWSLTEFPRQRLVFAARASSFGL